MCSQMRVKGVLTFKQVLVAFFVIPARPFVIPAKAGIHSFCAGRVDPRLRGDDKGADGDDKGERGDDRGAKRQDTAMVLAQVLMVFGLLLIGTGTGLWAQETTQVSNTLFYLQDDPSAAGGLEFVLDAHGFKAGTALYKKCLCVKKLDTKGADTEDAPVCANPAQAEGEEPKSFITQDNTLVAACSEPMGFVRHGALHYDADTRRVYMATQGSEEQLRRIVNGNDLSLSEFNRMEHTVDIRSIPVSRPDIQHRIEEVEKIYTEDNLLFDACRESLMRVTGMKGERIDEILNLNSLQAEQFFKQEENFCRLLALKGDKDVFATRADVENPLHSHFLACEDCERGDALGRGETQRYQNQLATIALFYFLLRVQDIDRVIAKEISKIEAEATLRFNPCAAVELFRILDERGEFNLLTRPYRRMWLGTRVGDERVGRVEGITNLGLTFHQMFSRLRSEMSAGNDSVTGAISSAITKAGEFGVLVEKINLSGQRLPFGYEALLSEIGVALRTLAPFDITEKTLLPSSFTLEVQAKLRALSGRDRLSAAEQNAFFLGVVGFTKALKLMKSFFETLQAIESGNETAQVVRTFLTGTSEETSLLNKHTFLSFQVDPRDTKDNELVFLGTDPRNISLRVQNVQEMAHSLASAPPACPQLEHPGLSRLQYYTDISNEIHGHERFRQQLKASVAGHSAEGGSDLKGTDVILNILKDRPDFLEYFMTEDVSGLISEYTSYLKIILRSLLRKPSIDSFLFDALEKNVSQAGSMDTVRIPLFSLRTSELAEGENLRRVYFDLSKDMRAIVDQYMFVAASQLENTLTQAGAQEAAQRSQLTAYVRDYLSDEAMKKMLFGCVTDQSLRAASTVKALPWTCTGEADASDIVGFKDKDEFERLHTQLNMFTLPNEFVRAYNDQREQERARQAERPNEPVLPELTQHEDLPIRVAFEAMSRLLHHLKQAEYTLSREALLRATLAPHIFGLPNIEQFVTEAESRINTVRETIQGVMRSMGSGIEIVERAMSDLATRRALAFSKLEMGFMLRATLFGMLLKDVQPVAEGLSPEVIQVGSQIKSRGMRLADAKRVFIHGLTQESQVLVRGLLNRKSVSELTEADRDALRVGRVLVVSGLGDSLYPLSRRDYLDSETALERYYLGELTQDPILAGHAQDMNDFRQGGMLMSVLTHRHGDKPKSTLFVSQAGKVRLYEDPSVLQSSVIGEAGGSDAMMEVKAIDESLEDMRFDETGLSVFRNRIRSKLQAPPPPPTSDAPVEAASRAYQVGTAGAASEKNTIGFPGRTHQIYRMEIEPGALRKLKNFVSNAGQEPRFSMQFEGAYLDQTVVSQWDDPQALKEWTERLQGWIGRFIDTSHPEIETSTWVSESFSPGLTRKAQFKTHVLSLPLVPLLQGYMADGVQDADVENVRGRLRAVEAEIASIQARLGSADEAQRQALADEVKQKRDEYKRLFDDIESIGEKDLLAFQVLVRHSASMDNPYFALHRYFPENTEPPADDRLTAQKLHVVMHEFTIWKLADVRGDQAPSENVSTPQVLVHYEDKPLIRPFLLGQYRYHPGAQHHVWDTWDAQKSARDADAESTCDAKCQNVYFYYDGSHVMAFNMVHGVWYRSEGWNRLGVDITDTAGQDLTRNSMSQVVAKRDILGIKDVTHMPYRLWLTIPHSPPFFNPLAGEWTFQRVFLSREGVGPNKQWMIGWTGFRNLIGEGIIPRSFTYVKEALAQPGSESALFVHPGSIQGEGENMRYGYQAARVTLWKNFNPIEISPVAGKNHFVLHHPAKTELMKDWLFYNFFETAFPQNESYIRNFHTFDTDRSGYTRYLWNVGESSLHFPYEFQRAAGDTWSALFEQDGVWETVKWFVRESKAVYFDSIPVCASLVYDVQGEFSARATLLNNKLPDTKSADTEPADTESADSEQASDRYFLPDFPGIGQTAAAARNDEKVSDASEHASYQRTVGPTILDSVPYTSESGQPAWLFSQLRAEYNPMYIQRGEEPAGIHGVRGELQDSSGHVQFTVPPLQRPQTPPDDPNLQRHSHTPINTWVPGMCMPFHTQGALTSITVVTE